MHKYTEKFVKYCEETFKIEGGEMQAYQSMSICILDCVYSLRTKYYSVTIPIVERYAAKYMNGNINAPGDNITQLLNNINAVGGPKAFADKVVKNHQQLGGKKHIPKEEVCYQLAKYLQLLHIDTIEDFQNFESQELLETVIHAVDGMGDAETNYLFMLAGDSDRCKPDVHIHRCIVDACGGDVTNDECQELFTDAVSYLKEKYPSLTVRILDGIVWRYYQEKSARVR